MSYQAYCPCDMRSMAGLVEIKHHLLLNLTDMWKKDKTFLLDALLSQEGIFRDVVTTEVEKLFDNLFLVGCKRLSSLLLNHN